MGEMTQDELSQLLGDEELLQVLDIKTLVLDMVKRMSETEILDIFWEKLPDLKETEVRDYFYMRRG